MEATFIMASHLLSSLDHAWQHIVHAQRDALDVDIDQVAHQLLIHLMEIARVLIRQPLVPLDGVLSVSTPFTSPSRSLPKARAARRRRRAKMSEGTKGSVTARQRVDEEGQHAGSGAGEGWSGWRRGWWVFDVKVEEARSARCAVVCGARDARGLRPMMAQKGSV